MKPSRIEDYALIGDCEAAALVSKTGSIDWLCWPNFSSPACFAALLGNASNGRWQIAPANAYRVRRRYLDHTLILETTYITAKGKVSLTDFMPIRGRHSDIVRIVHGVEGEVPMTLELAFRPDFGRTVPWLQHHYRHSYTATAGPGTVYLRTGMAAGAEIRFENGTMAADFSVRKGQTLAFVLTYASATEPAPRPVNPLLALRQTTAFWTKWAARGAYKGKWAAEVERSLITLKALTYRPTGGIIAAPTSSLPEQRGGALNWDYRYCWLRDATFTLLAFLNAGYTDEALAWEAWLLRAVAGDPSQVQIMYGLSGERQIEESEIPWLPGYANSRPVRTGNAASHQLQLDIYGEMADALYQARHAGICSHARDLDVQHKLVDHLRKIWQQPDAGIWEERGKPRQFTYSKAMAWVSLDRAIKSIERHRMNGPVEQWKKVRRQIHDEVCRKGFDRRLNSFVVHFGSKKVDGSLLLLPLVGFLPATDPRILGTLEAIEKQLLSGGLLLRFRPASKAQQEGAFLACSFWLAQVFALVGRKADARKLFQKLLKLRNDVGLLSEEYDTRGHRFMGNFPQALSHIALVNTAFRLDPPKNHQRRE